MNGMLQHHDIYREVAERHQREVRARATVDRLGRSARETRNEAMRRWNGRIRSHAHSHSMHARVRALRMQMRAWVSPLVPHIRHH